jgi:glycine cleavage system H protein
MPDDLTFHMGEYPARIPGDRLYATNHMWVEAAGSERRCGFTAYAVRLLQDVYFLEWTVDPGQTLAFRQQIGMIESSKAEAELYAPFAGAITALNEELLEDPSAINLETYGAGWLFHMQADFSAALSPAEYIELLESVWEETQRTIKGQLND